MGQFSFITSEGESIRLASTRKHFTVWMVLPDNTKYREDRYVGYGYFGGEHFYEAVAKLNGKRGIDAGIKLFFGHEEGLMTGVILPRFTTDPDKPWDHLKDPGYCYAQGMPED